MGPTLDPQWFARHIEPGERTVNREIVNMFTFARVREVEDVTMQQHIEPGVALIDVQPTRSTRRKS